MRSSCHKTRCCGTLRQNPGNDSGPELSEWRSGEGRPSRDGPLWQAGKAARPAKRHDFQSFACCSLTAFLSSRRLRSIRGAKVRARPAMTRKHEPTATTGTSAKLASHLRALREKIDK